jgi:dolichol-phosphate mannosyltransferase
VSPDKVTVVVPTYNERENIADLAASVTAQGLRLLIVDDNSPDGTGALADDIAARDTLVEVLHRPAKAGLGPAYGNAFDFLLAGDSHVIVEMDADFSHDPGDLPRLIQAIEDGADIAIGSRYVPGGGAPDWSWLRRFVSKAGNIYARLMLGIPTRDATAGFRAFRSTALARLPYRRARASGYGFQVEMAWRAHQEGLNVVEVPIVFRDRVRGRSKMGLAIVAEAMWLVTLWGLRRLVGLERNR